MKYVSLFHYSYVDFNDRFALTYVSDFIPWPNMHMQLTNLKLSIRDRFILSRLNNAIQDANKHMTDYNFAGVTTTLHSFFLYDVRMFMSFKCI